jgi:hypothetical protein
MPEGLMALDWTSLKNRVAKLWRREAIADPFQPATPGAAVVARPLWRRVLDRTGLGVISLLVFALLYWGVLGWWLSTVDRDLTFRPSPADLPPKGSVTIGMASAVMDREVNQHGWVPNNPWFFPTWWLDNMPSFQRGVLKGVGQVVLETRDQIGRLRGTGGTDADLEQAFTAFSYPPDRWWLNWEFRALISSSSESQYRDGIGALRKYNARVASGQALFERRADTLAATLDRLALSLGAASNALNDHATKHSGDFIDTQDDNVFYEAQGEAYAAYLLLSGLRQDYDGLVRNRELAAIWDQLQQGLRQAAELDPLIVVNGDPAGTILPNHLLTLNAYMQTSRARLREITNILAR